MFTPMPLSRREVLATAATLGISASSLGGGEAQAGTPLADQSALVTGQLKPLKYLEIPGLLTAEQINPHYAAHYGGALRAYQSDEQQIEALLKSTQPAGGPAHAHLVRDRTNRLNSVLLHELYFDGLAPKPPETPEALRQVIARRFGSFHRWLEDFKACCLAANGWGILARDPVSGKLYNLISDVHEVGVIWQGQPLVVCDVYEHAFYVDYQNRKAEYVSKLVQFIDWSEVERRYRALAK